MNSIYPSTGKKEKMSEEDKKWRARDDVHTLTQVDVINSDPERMKLAAQAAKEMEFEARMKAKSMSKIAKKGGKKK